MTIAYQENGRLHAISSKNAALGNALYSAQAQAAAAVDAHCDERNELLTLNAALFEVLRLAMNAAQNIFTLPPLLPPLPLLS